MIILEVVYAVPVVLVLREVTRILDHRTGSGTIAHRSRIPSVADVGDRRAQSSKGITLLIEVLLAIGVGPTTVLVLVALVALVPLTVGICPIALVVVLIIGPVAGNGCQYLERRNETLQVT